jgi:hypothetical protein
MPRPTRIHPAFIRLVSLAAVSILLAACAAEVRVAAPVPPVAVVEVRTAPPPLPVYVQPPCPVAGWMWTPGYWAWGPAGYFWVPGTWVAPPRIGVLWTPGYWGFVSGVYVWHAGYWGPHVGFYGGVHYGFGYTGVGYAGGRWVGGVFAYNRSVTNVNVTIIHNTYNQTVVNRFNVTRVSYNGGVGGVMATPTAQQRLAAREHHLQPTRLQLQHREEAQRTPALLAQANHGRPAIAATTRPGAFNGPGVVRARGAAWRANSRRGQMRRNMNRRNPAMWNAAHRRPAVRRPAAKRKPPRKNWNAWRKRRGRPEGQ